MVSVSRLLDAQLIENKWPIAIAGDPVPNSDWPPHSYCLTKCENRECMNRFIGRGRHTCHAGLSFYQTRIDGDLITIFGVIEKGDQLQKKGRDFRKAFRGRTVTELDFMRWHQKMDKVQYFLDSWRTENIREALNPLHDAIKWANEIYNLAENEVNRLRGSDFRNKLAGSSGFLKSIFNSARMLQDMFDFIAIYFNPQAAAFGNKRSTEIYKLVDKVVQISNAAPSGSKKRITLQGVSHRRMDVYESFKLIPIALIHNAIKYTKDDSVEVRIIEDANVVRIEVETLGPLIEESELARIFERGYRGRHAKGLKIKGTGVGLYTARIVAEVHGTTIEVNSERINSEFDGVPLAKNLFAVDVH